MGSQGVGHDWATAELMNSMLIKSTTPKKDQFLKTHKLPKLSEDEIEGPHISVPIKHTEFGNRKIPLKKKLSSTDGFTG